MNETALRDLCQKRGFSAEQTEKALAAVRALESFLLGRGTSLEDASAEDIRAYLDLLIRKKRCLLEDLLAMARYFYLAGRNEIYIYFTSLLGGVGVIENIEARLAGAVGNENAKNILSGLARPPLGSDPSAFPAFTSALMERLEQSLPEDTLRQALAGNNHGIPASAFDTEKTEFEKAVSLDAYLRGKHARQVAELQRCCDKGEVWFEQTITQDVVDFVSANQEILSAVRDGNVLYVTKIPYDPAKYLTATDPAQKRYYACHCPFAREAIKSGGPCISENWCYCSGGFAKYPFEVLFGRSLRVELLSSVLRGDQVCRFAVHLD